MASAAAAAAAAATLPPRAPSPGASETDPDVSSPESDLSAALPPPKKARRSLPVLSALPPPPPPPPLPLARGSTPPPAADAAAAAADSLYSAGMLMDLAGSTSAEVRRMNEDERALVHYKRRLRNRESAKRSRARRQATLNDIQAEVCELRDVAQRLLDRCARLARAGDRAVAEAETLRKENSLLESMLRSESAAALPTERRCGV